MKKFPAYDKAKIDRGDHMINDFEDRFILGPKNDVVFG